VTSRETAKTGLGPGPAARPRLVATDLDGTLLRSDGTVSERTRAALVGCAGAGIDVVFVTARPPRTILPVVEQTGIADIAAASSGATVAICSNGAVLYDFGTGNNTYVHEFSVEAARRVVDLLRPALPDAGFALETGEDAFREAAFLRSAVTPPPGAVAVESLDTAWASARRFVKVMARSPVRHADEMLAESRRILGDLAEPSHSGARGLVELAPPGSTKAGTLALLCDERGIDAQSVAAFGDMPNDLPMLRWAGLPCAVANAHRDVLAAVRTLTGSNDEDGVAAMLETWFV
jgi:HAD superfamily hydrolase (TIGR01484 family)